jgi:hypothetical protein
MTIFFTFIGQVYYLNFVEMRKGEWDVVTVGRGGGDGVGGAGRKERKHILPILTRTITSRLKSSSHLFHAYVNKCKRFALLMTGLVRLFFLQVIITNSEDKYDLRLQIIKNT